MLALHFSKSIIDQYPAGLSFCTNDHPKSEMHLEYSFKEDISVNLSQMWMLIGFGNTSSQNKHVVV